MSETCKAEKKVKLRTASQVISRLKWSEEGNDCINIDDCLIGYECRINGPMEKCVADFTPIQKGGDIPEHRIQYFRNRSITNIEQSVFWDRNGRVDRLFSSGAGRHAPVSQKTVVNVKAAIENMKRLAEEKAILVAEKAKKRARQYARKAAAVNLLDSSLNAALYDEDKRSHRHIWEAIDHCFSFNSNDSIWFKKKCFSPEKSSFRHQHANGSVKFLTWNVLFDLTKNENNDFVQGDYSLLGERDSTWSRWEHILEEIESENPCVIALQEVTRQFLIQLQAKDWIRQNYELTSSLDDPSCLNPFGNLIAWRKDRFHLRGLYMCNDMNRHRAVVASLQMNDRCIYNVANVHLPSDHHNNMTKETDDRTKARQREISAIIAKIEDLEQNLQKHISIPIVLGDFNTDTNNLLPLDYYNDLWELSEIISGDNDGFTYNWKVNKRAEKIHSLGYSKKDPRRIDRLYVGTKHISDDFFAKAKLVGNSKNYEFHPSDHFGVCITIDTKQTDSIFNLHSEDTLHHKAWSTTALPSSDSLLALVLDDEDRNFYDQNSTLPLSHITLLNGFVDISSVDRQRLACRVIQNVMQQVSSCDERRKWTISLDYNSFQIFEHQHSATLVCCPNMEEEGNIWLKQLYNALRAAFAQCNEQECRFLTGWTPHISLGSYANSLEARTALASSFCDNFWQASFAPVGIGLFRRDYISREFHLATSISLVDVPNWTVHLQDDAGESLTKQMCGVSSFVLKEVERACRFAAESVDDNHEKSVESSIHIFGSYALGVALPTISDIDAVVEVKGINSRTKVQLFLEVVASRLSHLHVESKIRLRMSTHSNERKQQILTFKLSKKYPSLDLIVCCIDSNGKPLNQVDEDSMLVLNDNALIKSSFGLFHNLNPKCERMICGAIRIVKIWAFRRQIYGTKNGFLGGGGWIILMIWLLSNSRKNDLAELFNHTSVPLAAKEIATFFFQNMLSQWSNESIITLNNILVENKFYGSRLMRLSNLNVIAPISHGNFGRSSTQATTLTLKRELQRAKLMVNAKHSFNGSILDMYQPIGPLFLILEVGIPDEDNQQKKKPAEIKAWGSSKQLSLVVDLEQFLLVDMIRPTMHTIRKKESFLFSVSIECVDIEGTKKKLDKFIDRIKCHLREEGHHSFGDVKVVLSCCTKETFLMQVKQSRLTQRSSG